MPAREFLGWDRPLLGRVVDWLLEHRSALPGMWVVVPTAESGRRVRESLAEAGNGVLSPQFMTPGTFLKVEDTVVGVAPDWVERVAWVETLEGVTDWSSYVALFPSAPEGESGWADGLAGEWVALRRTLQENGQTLAAAARRLHDSVEAARWEALAKLEAVMEGKLAAWGLKSRSRVLAAGGVIPAGVSHIVLAGVTELPQLLERALLAWEASGGGRRVTVLISAPETEAEMFSEIGRPLSGWNDRSMPWPEGAAGSVQVVADPRQQAVAALRVLGQAGTASDAVALGTADPEAGGELARELTRAGWPAHHPAAARVTTGLARWFKLWHVWLAEPTLATLADLLSMPETETLVGGDRSELALNLAGLRDRWMARRPEDLRRRIDAGTCRNAGELAAARAVLAAAELLETKRVLMAGAGFARGLADLLAVLGRTGPDAAAAAAAMADWLSAAVPVLDRLNRPAGFWLQVMLDDMPDPMPVVPSGRVIDVQGWLELLFEPGLHLVLCGMNEGRVPARSGGEPWLGEAARDRLGLITDAMRAARDAFLYQSMVAARTTTGRVDVICGKTGAGGETLLPSRLLLAATQDALPGRVRSLFREIEPPEAGLRWHADWQWQPAQLPPPGRISVTAIRDYLACPFRFYLKHVVGMQTSDTGRMEWNARDFGNVAHTVLERWGDDLEAREFDRTEALEAWFSAELDRVVTEWFGSRVPLAVRIQTESLRQRLAWAARIQACEHAAGWQVVDVERKVEIAVGETVVVARIDRIDRHRDTGELRVIDYKTGTVAGVDRAHRKKMTAAAPLLAHLPGDSPAFYAGAEAGKPAVFRWVNLQLPLYAAALTERGESMPVPAYFGIGGTAADVGIQVWQGFSEADVAAARACAAWVVGRVAQGVFGPPAERVDYDDFSILAAGRTLPEMVVCR